MQAPTGTITFLFTDIEGSSQLWERFPEPMRMALSKHDTILREAFETRGGFVFKTIGDAFCVAFDTAPGAVDAALEAQRLLNTGVWEETGPLQVRMALHTGSAEQRDGDYFGQSLNRVSRLLAAAHGGQILLSLPTEELVRDHLGDGVRLRDLGERRLRDLTRPERIYQLVANDLPSEFPPLRSLESVPNNLPAQLTTFIGREREMGEVKRLLGSTHLLTLTGTGGTGKTRLSLQVAADVLEQFSDGAWLVEFATIDDAAVVPETVAAALNVRQEAERPLTATLTSFLHAKNLLLLFDNCEHVIAAGARLAETQLRACPHLRILASSREPLGIAGETAWTLPPLSSPQDYWREIVGGPDAMERFTQFESVRLFIERATAARPAFALTNENIVTVAQICSRLDGIPLAIELAAARIKVLTLQQIAERLDDRFRLLTGGSRTAMPRQQTLRALIDWSYDLLTEPEQKLLRRLSVFARGRTLEAIEAVCAGEGVEDFEVIDLLTQLVDKSLVTVEKTPEHGARYFITESIWDYGHGKLEEAGEMDAVRVRHLDYFVKFAEETEPRLSGPGQRLAFGRVEEESINVRFAIETACELSGQARKGLRIMSALARYVEVRGLFKEARELGAKLLAHPETVTRDAVRAKALAAAARLAWVSDDLVPGLKFEQEALALFREIGDRDGLVDVLNDMAMYLWDAGDLEGAKKHLDEAETLLGDQGSMRLRADLLGARGAVAATEGRHEESLALNEESLALYRELGDGWLVAVLQWAVGVTALLLGHVEQARNYFRENLEAGRGLGTDWGLPFSFEAFAALAVTERQFERAARLLGASEAMRERVGISTAPADHPALRQILTTAAEPFTQPEMIAARHEGRAMTADEAVTLALAG